MTDNNTSPALQAEVLFRSNKRRKVFRQRHDIEHGQHAAILTNEASHGATTSSKVEDDEGDGMAFRAHRPNALRKHGIAYTSTSITPRPSTLEDDPNEGALLPFDTEKQTQQQQQKIMPHIERFVKPTGKVAAVADDSHITAYVDSKLAELRAAKTTTTSPFNAGDIVPVQQDEGRATFTTATSPRSDAPPVPPTGSGSRSLDAAQAGNMDPSQRLTNDGKDKPNNRRPRRRAPPPRPEADIARDALIEQLMRGGGEGQVPVYSHHTDINATLNAHADKPHAQPNSPFISEGGHGIGDEREEVNNDEAVALAFREQLVAEMELHKRRKPLSGSAGGKQAAAASSSSAMSTSSGPKLGGSRMQREKMKAMEAAAKMGGGAAGRK